MMDCLTDQKVLHNIYNKIIEMIPEEWDKIYLYGEVNESAGLVSFYYFPKDNKEYVFSAMIPHLFEMSAIDYYNDEDELQQLVKKLHDEAAKNAQDNWTSVTITIDGEKISVDYDYADLSESTDYERQIIWEYRYLGVGPRDEGDTRIIEKYLKANK